MLLGFGEQETGGLGKFLLYPLASMVAADVKGEAGLRALSWIFGASLPASALNKVAGSCLRANLRLRIESEKKDYDSLAATLKKWCEAELPDIRTWLTELSEDFDLVVASNYLVGVGAIAEAVDQNVFQQIDAVLKGILERVKSNKVAAGALQISRIAQYH